MVTSCGRQDLLRRTLDSFFACNTYPLAQMIVVEDGEAAANRRLVPRYRARPIRWIATGARVGQIAAIDLAYARLRTPYIFHLEDDWEFTRGGFIEASLAILCADPACLLVWLRGPNDTNGHPLLPEVRVVEGVRFRWLQPDYRGVWHGFSFAPGLRRLRDYRRIGSYGQHVLYDPAIPALAESHLSILYRALGFRCALALEESGQGYLRHIGDGRHVGRPENASPSLGSAAPPWQE